MEEKVTILLLHWTSFASIIYQKPYPWTVSMNKHELWTFSLVLTPS